MKHPILAVFLFVMSLSLGCATNGEPQRSQNYSPCTRQDLSECSRYVGRKIERACRAIVFIHGVTGDSYSTWANSDKIYWPQLMAEDPTFNGANIYVFNYLTSVFRTSPSIHEVATNLGGRLNAEGILDAEELYFVAHSMGGLVLRGFLLQNQKVGHQKVKLAYFYGTPTAGSDIANLSRLLPTGNPQFYEMRTDAVTSDLHRVIRDWPAARFSFPSMCAYEALPTIGTTHIVPLTSAADLCSGGPPLPISANHIDIVKPVSMQSDSYMFFRRAYQENQLTRNLRSISLEFSANDAIGLFYVRKPADPDNPISQYGALVDRWDKCDECQNKMEAVSPPNGGSRSATFHIEVGHAGFYKLLGKYGNNGQRVLKVYLDNQLLLDSAFAGRVGNGEFNDPNPQWLDQGNGQSFYLSQGPHTLTLAAPEGGSFPHVRAIRLEFQDSCRR